MKTFTTWNICCLIAIGFGITMIGVVLPDDHQPQALTAGVDRAQVMAWTDHEDYRRCTVCHDEAQTLRCNALTRICR